MVTVIPRGVKIPPGPYFRGPTMNDAVAASKFDLHYDRIGRSRSYRVYRFSGKDRQEIGAVISWFNSPCWAFIPCLPGSGDRWYIARTRFEAINACLHLIR